MTKKSFEEQVLENLHGLKNDVHGLKNDVHGLKNDVHGLKKDVQRVEVLQEEMRDDITRIVEGVSSIHEDLAHKADQQAVEDMAQDIKTIPKSRQSYESRSYK